MSTPTQTYTPPDPDLSVNVPNMNPTVTHPDRCSSDVDSGLVAARRHIYYTNERGTRFNMTALHRMNMHYLRKRILDEAGEFFVRGGVDDGLSGSLAALMRDYCMFFFPFLSLFPLFFPLL